MGGLAWSYYTIQISQRRLAIQLRVMHEYLVLQEKRLKKKLNDEFEKTTTSINNIINEITNLSAQFTKKSFNNSNGVNGTNDGEVDRMD
ncbi:hypothetical protein SAMD00019534_078960 [Acytostelium subglobosum LB1]|uniref:hypothetical protein n=1 Tax=Acytostelium subglobosum LB1 TaxID=1410327 RepID=UPI00064505F6|nr:hypothetical protein SAMD00019534_078960 [Acytostelium subglobosum LB1]GAM24721.1 hypothetical protein SAMD00019534_078960 [Acytostelium subglobosum LB1]|eukprot:XP_012752390.1 hypothetical protein SAMD00019534_078960 [Acytostelium subglobosum LB1]